MRLIHKMLLIMFSLSKAFVAFANPLWHFTSRDVNLLHSKPANYRIYYGEDHLQYGDLRIPDGRGPYPIAIIIHGGCWVSTFANVENTSAFADALRDRGIATWNIEYRREDNQGGGWPGTFQDVANAMDFLRELQVRYRLDLNQLIAIGHSAGGHLALWLAARGRLPSDSLLFTREPLLPRGVLVLGGVPDLKVFRRQAEKTCEGDVILKLLGNSTEQLAKRYQETSPINLLPLGVSQILIYGTEDQAVPRQYARHYAHLAEQAGDKIKLINVADAAHHEYIVPNSLSWPLVKKSVLTLLQN